MEEAPFRNIVRAVTAAALLTAGCEASSRPIPTATFVPTRGPVARPIETPPPSPAGEPTPKRQEEFQREIQTSIGVARIVFVLGKDRPESGVYTHFINPVLLRKIKEPFYGLDYREPSLFRLQAEIHPFFAEKRVVVKGRLGRDDKEGPRDSRTVELLEIDLNSPQLLVLGWKNWKFEVFYWGKEAEGKPKDVKA